LFGLSHSGNHEKVVVVYIFLDIGKFEEFVVGFVQFGCTKIQAESLVVVVESSSSASGGESYGTLVYPYLGRVDYFVALPVF
jgi:hypothetical protein